MGGGSSKSEHSHGQKDTLPTEEEATEVISAPCPTASPNKEIYLILAFFAGVLLTLMLMAFIFLIIKSYRKRRSSPRGLDPHSDPPTKLSAIPEESLTYASMSFKTSEAKSNHLTENCCTDVDPVVYAPIKVAN
ncbi:transmembrane protein C1orf162 homolog [Loxodonta africana]|uniref:transmembrane protein C1orf162 homolog n=1 Tax=Loxodonta africana TaxID=9785 RepID=UPI0030D2A50A